MAPSIRKLNEEPFECFCPSVPKVGTKIPVKHLVNIKMHHLEQKTWLFSLASQPVLLHPPA